MNQNKSVLTINGEINEVTKILAPFTHGVKSKFFDGLGEYVIGGTQISESAGSGLFVGRTVVLSENIPTIDDLNVLFAEYSDLKVVAFLETPHGSVLAAADGALAV